MKHKNLVTLLESYIPTPEEKPFQQQILEFVYQYPNCCDRSLLVGHITASAWIINKENTHALLMHHTKLNKWIQLGGHCEGNTDVLAVALQEACEESGIQSIAAVHTDIFDLDVHSIPARAQEPEHYHYDIRFLLQVTSSEQGVRNHESKALRWIGKEKDELPTNERSVNRMFDKWILYKNY